MPLRSSYQLNREGITADTVGRFLRRTAFNPFLTVPLWLLAHYTEQGRSLAAQHLSPNGLRTLKILLQLSVFQKVQAYLDAAVMNNWTNDTYDWTKEIVVVTGGSDGIGAIVVKLLAERGIRVVVLDVQDLKYDAPPTVSYFKCDLSNHEDIARVTAEVQSAIGNPTILINNAGVAKGKTILDSTPRDISLTFNVNALAHYHLAHAFLPHMISTNHGMIVTVASAAGYVTAPAMVDYASSKAAAVSFHEGLSAELSTIYSAPKVRTVLIAQGYTRTALFQGFKSGDPFLNYVLYAETVAEEIVKAVLEGRSRTIYLPGVGRFLARNVRSWSGWMQYGFRKRTVELMRGWRGRQVVQPAEVEGGEDFGVRSLVEEKGGLL